MPRSRLRKPGKRWKKESAWTFSLGDLPLPVPVVGESIFRRHRAESALLETQLPLGRWSDPHPWVTEMRASPWGIFVLIRPGDE
jgi:hypothetical protein